MSGVVTSPCLVTLITAEVEAHKVLLVVHVQLTGVLFTKPLNCDVGLVASDNVPLVHVHKPFPTSGVFPVKLTDSHQVTISGPTVACVGLPYT